MVIDGSRGVNHKKDVLRNKFLFVEIGQIKVAVGKSSVGRGKGIVADLLLDKVVQELLKMGAKINVSERYATIVGVGKLKPSNVSCPDLRGGAGLVLAGLVAKGETVVDEIFHIERGYYNLDEKLKSLGAIIEKVDSD